MNKNSPGANLAKHMSLVVNSTSTESVVFAAVPFVVDVCLMYRYATAADVGFIMLLAPSVGSAMISWTCPA